MCEKITNVPLFEKDLVLPEHKLLIAIIEQAVSDAQRPDRQTAYAKKAKSGEWRIKPDAIAFLTKPNAILTGLLRLLNVDENHFMERIKKLLFGHRTIKRGELCI